jgi:hypothetical protein
MGILTWNRLSHAVEKYAIGTYTCANVLAPYKTWDVVTFHRRKNGNAEKLFFFLSKHFFIPAFFSSSYRHVSQFFASCMYTRSCNFLTKSERQNSKCM